MKLIDIIDSPDDLKKLTTDQLVTLSKELRTELIDLVSKGYIEQIGAGRSTKYILKELTNAT